MNKSDFLREMTKALKDNGVTDVQEIIAEYEEHFTFKLADGFSEEEIAVKLGSPTELAQQYSSDRSAPALGKKAVMMTGLVLGDILAGALFIVLFAVSIVLAAAAASFLAIGVYLFFDMDFIWFMPGVPYGAALLYALGLLALSALTVCGTAYYISYALSISRAFARFHKNLVASASGGPSTPPMPVRTRFKARTRRAIRIAALGSLTTCVFLLAAAFVTSALTAGAVEFWHVWGWFAG